MLFKRLGTETNWAEQFFDQLSLHQTVIRRGIVGRKHSPRELSKHRSDLALEATDSRFSSIVLGDRADPVFGEIDLLRSEAVRFELLAQQMTHGDLQLLALGVTRQPNYLQPVLQRRRDRVKHIRRSNEHHIREVILDVEIVIVE